MLLFCCDRMQTLRLLFSCPYSIQHLPTNKFTVSTQFNMAPKVEIKVCGVSHPYRVPLLNLLTVSAQVPHLQGSLFQPLQLDPAFCYKLNLVYPTDELPAIVSTSFEVIHDPRKCGKSVYMLKASTRDYAIPYVPPIRWCQFRNSYYGSVKSVHFEPKYLCRECACLVALKVHGWSNIEEFGETLILKVV